MTINDLIHTNAHNAFEQGVKTERQRIIELLESDPEEVIDCGGGLRAGYEIAIALIKGEQK